MNHSCTIDEPYMRLRLLSPPAPFSCASCASTTPTRRCSSSSTSLCSHWSRRSECYYPLCVLCPFLCDDPHLPAEVPCPCRRQKVALLLEYTSTVTSLPSNPTTPWPPIHCVFPSSLPSFLPSFLLGSLSSNPTIPWPPVHCVFPYCMYDAYHRYVLYV